MNLIISGTNRLGSNSLKVANYYKAELNRKSEQWEIFSLEDLPHDILFTDLYGKRSEAFSAIQAKVSAAQKFIFIIPEYNGSYPGVLKIFIDACAYPSSFANKKAALVGVSTGKYGNIRGVDHFTGVCNYVRMHVLPLKIHVPHIQNELDPSGCFVDPITLKFIDEQIEEILRF
ncbi:MULTISPECIES: NADPH-dependent FMN reductase [Sphingobacterium]|uniref:NAD(P)H-dependent oxidoreductase n=1 Tax=Sphingobacterium litopenaei TaxID=2763500 RepID=A0ABR7YH45_9SPHI|nr:MULTISPECIES: NAD(P)H-dependent oxidoreductase [Sphingobacterium]MBD1430647.1 NAD(P)H-dependent oxidoreductase [Sphingobacterium litopenaei]NGM72436.1 NAD(P)H-dependent oxidoreductase [Sphingobacterium sp. SGL-16]